MTREDIGISDGAVRDATGRSWAEWESEIDGWGGRELDHQEIVALVAERGGVASGWWQQAVTNGYEKLVGRRAAGQMADGSFQIGVSRILDVSPDRVWGVVRSPEGICAWLGECRGLTLDAGVAYGTLDGASGEVRVVGASHLRMTWHPDGWPEPSTVQLRVDPTADGRARVSFHQEGIPDGEERESRRAWYRGALDRIEELTAR